MAQNMPYTPPPVPPPNVSVSNQTVQKRTGKGFRIAGIVFFVLCALYFVIGVTEDSTMLAAALFCGFVGIPFFLVGKNQQKWLEKYYRYLAMIQAGERTLDGLAAACSTTPQAVIADMQTLIGKGYFTGLYLDVSQRVIVVSAASNSAPPAAGPTQPRTCPGCGAVNHVKPGKPAVCEYCGSPVQ